MHLNLRCTHGLMPHRLISRMRSLRPSLAGMILVACPACIPALAAQSAVQAAPQFDVAAIHLHEPQPHERSHIVSENGSFTTVNVDLKSILQWAYDLPESRIVGGPSWLSSARWDIEAKADNALDTLRVYDRAAAQLEKRRMVQSLLADR